MRDGADREELFALIAAARREVYPRPKDDSFVVRRIHKLERETPKTHWLVQCDHTFYQAEVIGPYHIKPGFCPACGRSASAKEKN